MSPPVHWISADWPVPPGVVAGTTLRQGGASSGRYATLNLGGHVGDEPRAVQWNRERFRESCGLPSEPSWLDQVHGTAVVSADGAGVSAEGDAMIATRPGNVCAILTADCLPVVLASQDGRCVAAAHAGWRGLCTGILEATVSAMEAAPESLLGWLGPAISQRAFEVGGEVRGRFVEQDDEAAAFFIENDRGRWQADLYGLARLRLHKAGVTRVHGGGRCTFHEPEAFFSFRRDGQCGRMATFVFRRRA